MGSNPYGLNISQMRAVTAPEGHMLVNAAAGTGKTTTVAARIIWLQNEKLLKPHEIIAITFSRSARQHLTDKIEKLCLDIKKGSVVRTYTFHGLGYRILRLAAELKETWIKPGFEIITASLPNDNPLLRDYYNDLFTGIDDEYEKETRIRIYAKALDMVRQGHPELINAAIKPEDLPVDIDLSIQIEAAAILNVSTNNIRTLWHRYNKLLKNTNRLDYPAIITEAIKVLRDKESLTKERVSEGLKYIIVDEYQDTSRAQEALLLSLAGDTVCINVVGDSDQTIYTFNGSDISNILEFEKRVAITGLPVQETINLCENYRSTQNILIVANRIIQSTGRVSDTKLVPATDIQSGPVFQYRLSNCDVSLIYTPRLELCAQYVAEECNRLISNNISAGDIAVLVRKNSEFSPQSSVIQEYLERAGITCEISESNNAQLESKINMITELCQMHYTDSIDQIIGLLHSGELDEYLNTISRPDIEALLIDAKKAGANFAYEVLDFIYDNYAAEETNDDNKLDINNIQIRTVHSAKGSEFRVVFLLYLADGQFPHGQRPDVAEELRLFYVGITRAQEKLYILGRNGIHGPDFFGDCKGPGTKIIDYTVPGGIEIFGKNKVAAEEVAAIEKARQLQKEEELRQREELINMFENEYKW